MNAYDRHKMLVNEYLLCYAGATDNVLKRDTSKDKTDMDVIKQHHKVRSNLVLCPMTFQNTFVVRNVNLLYSWTTTSTINSNHLS